ncbi:hypothetical protein UFOVP20_40 [uncultured Caudovirales phage]|uniref:Uncharacterized protein n=1 Tax=uncultured Caudovirales phage TaxID=2100421 RepID=A0A6J5KLG8_9CAUD|nr:hypothetical protein UFOVP20_40 [uncultured Caudovirales phage]
MGLRDALEENFEAAEDGTLGTPVEREIDVAPVDPIEIEAKANEVPERDEKGKFISKDEQPDRVVASEDTVSEVEERPNGLQRPTTFKKEYLPIWEKMAAGQQLTPEESVRFAEYAGNIRENEFKKGVSTYKAEADNARSMMEAIAPFVPELQKQNIHPAAWINNLGRAHMTLTNAPYEQRVQLFHRLAADYGIQLNQEAGQYPQYQQPNDQYTQQLMQQLQAMNQEVSTIKGRYEQEENTRLMSEINQVAQNKDKFPHFEEVRERMAQLLENNLASDLETAYAKAVRLEDHVWAKEQDRLLKQATQTSNKAQQVAKAKAVAVSPRSVTPNGVVASSDKKDRRSMLDELVSSSMGGRV